MHLKRSWAKTILLIIWIWMCCFNFKPSSLSLGSRFRREAADTTVLSLFSSNKRWLKTYWLVLTKAFHVFLSVSPSVHPKKKNRQTCVRKSLICAFAMAFIISVMLIAANQMLRNGME